MLRSHTTSLHHIITLEHATTMNERALLANRNRTTTNCYLGASTQSVIVIAIVSSPYYHSGARNYNERTRTPCQPESYHDKLLFGSQDKW
jgi:hypothetical protein